MRLSSKLGFSSPLSSQRSLLPDLNSGHHLQREGAPAASPHRPPCLRCPAAGGSVVPPHRPAATQPVPSSASGARERRRPPHTHAGEILVQPRTAEEGGSRWSGSRRRPAGSHGTATPAIPTWQSRDMEAENSEVAALVEKITGLHAAISKLPSLSPSPEVDALFTELVAACVPSSPVDVTKLSPEAQEMRQELICLCSTAEGLLEAHYSDMLTALDNPLDHLGRFPYFDNYINLSKLEHGLLPGHVAAPARVAFIGSGPLPFSSLFLATYHLPDTRFDNYDRCSVANGRARKLVGAADEGVRSRMAFHTAEVADLTAELQAYDVVFLAALVGMTSEEKANTIAHLGKHMSDGAVLVARSAHGARAFLYPVVELDDIGRGGFQVLDVHHPAGDEVFNSFIVARKVNISQEMSA